MAERALQRCGRKLKANNRRLCLKDCAPTPDPCCIERVTWQHPTPLPWVNCGPPFATDLIDSCLLPGQLARAGRRLQVQFQGQVVTTFFRHNLIPIFQPVDFTAVGTVGVTFEVEFVKQPGGGCHRVYKDAQWVGSMGGTIRDYLQTQGQFVTLANYGGPLELTGAQSMESGLFLGGFRYLAAMAPVNVYRVMAPDDGTFNSLTAFANLFGLFTGTGNNIQYIAPLDFPNFFATFENQGVFNPVPVFPGPEMRLWCVPGCGGSRFGQHPTSPETKTLTWQNSQAFPIGTTTVSILHEATYDQSPFEIGGLTTQWTLSGTVSELEPCDLPPGGPAPGQIATPGPVPGGNEAAIAAAMGKDPLQGCRGCG